MTLWNDTTLNSKSGLNNINRKRVILFFQDLIKDLLEGRLASVLQEKVQANLAANIQDKIDHFESRGLAR